MIKNKDWRDYLPRGTKAQLAEKFGITRMAVTRIIRDEDVKNHPDLIKEAREIGLKTIAACEEHEKAVHYATT